MKERLMHGVVMEIMCWGGEYFRLWLYQGKHTFVEQELPWLYQQEETLPHHTQNGPAFGIYEES